MALDTGAVDWKTEDRLTAAYLAVALLALFGGTVLGLFQPLEHAGINLYPRLAPVITSSYQGLSLHGVLNVLVWTTFFISGFLQFITARALRTPLWSRRLALAQAWLWFGGMAVFSNAQHRLGLMGMPRRTMIGAAPYLQLEWGSALVLVGIGGTILFVSALLYFANIVLTVLASREQARVEIPFAEALSGPEHTPAILDRWRPWLAVAGILIAMAYGPTLIRLATTTPLTTPGYRVW